MVSRSADGFSTTTCQWVYVSWSVVSGRRLTTVLTAVLVVITHLTVSSPCPGFLVVA